MRLFSLSCLRFYHADQRDRAQEEVADLEARRAELQQQVEKLDLERTEALKQLNKLSQENVELAGQLNSVIYRVGTFSNFQKQGVLRKRALGKWRTAELEKMLQSAEKAGMDVHIRGHLYISQMYKEKHGDAWSSLIDPKNPGVFFDGYTILWMDLMPMFTQYKVKLITLFTEMDGIEKYPALMKRMYSKLSETFTGELGFEEATNLMLAGISPMQNGRTFHQMVRNFTFWNWADSSGRPMRIEYSGWSASAETQKDQRVSVMTPNFVKFWKPAVNYYSSTYPQNPQMFGEFGAYNADGQSLGFKYYDIPVSRRVMDEQERSDYILAALKGAKDLDVIMALNLWGDFYPGDSCTPGVGWAITRTGHYGYLASPMYRVFTAIIAPEKE